MENNLTFVNVTYLMQIAVIRVIHVVQEFLLWNVFLLQTRSVQSSIEEVAELCHT